MNSGKKIKKRAVTPPVAVYFNDYNDIVRLMIGGGRARGARPPAIRDRYVIGKVARGQLIPGFWLLAADAVVLSK